MTRHDQDLTLGIALAEAERHLDRAGDDDEGAVARVESALEDIRSEYASTQENGQRLLDRISEEHRYEVVHVQSGDAAEADTLGGAAAAARTLREDNEGVGWCVCRDRTTGRSRRLLNDDDLDDEWADAPG